MIISTKQTSKDVLALKVGNFYFLNVYRIFNTTLTSEGPKQTSFFAASFFHHDF